MKLIIQCTVAFTLVLSTLTLQANERVLVVGAGMAGLTAARDLKAAGYEVVVLEARNRLGGRTYTDNVSGINLDMGASWIHGIEDNVMYHTAVEAGVAVSEITDYELYKNYDFDGSPNVISAAQDESFVKLIIKKCRRHANNGTDTSMETMLEDMFDDGDFDRIVDNRREFDYLTNTFLEHEYAGDVTQMSAQQCWEGEDSSGGDVIIPEGHSQIVDYLAQGLNIKLNAVVTKVIYGKRGVTIKTSRGSYKGDRAVITVPLGVLKAGDITFSPALPSSKFNAIAELGSGTLNKTWMIFPYAFWDTDVLMIGYVSDPKDVFTEWYSFDDLEVNKVLLGFNGGARAAEMESMTDQEITAEAMTVLRAMYGPGIPEPTKVIQTRWNSDRFSKGSYSFLAAGGNVESTRRKLRKSVDDRLFFAGEATSIDYPGTTDGAMETGARAARKIINL
ncbi:MAG: monoamine oxidase [Oceanicoccus sp.]|jgi:monoamine oxidase